MSIKRVGLISFGCPKNTADSESLIRRLSEEAGIAFESDPEMADAVVINTCGFIEDAKRESIDAILSAASSRHSGQKLIVMGCLAKRYGAELAAELPEVDAFFGVAEEGAIVEFLRGEEAAIKPPVGMSSLLMERGVSAPSVPIKVAEGCDRKCTYCVIPSIRGPFLSRTPESILHEAERYVRAGARELVLVAQDLTAYGHGTDYRLPELIRDIASISGDFWIRPMYLHPSGVDDALLEVFAEGGKVVPYIDMPLQHSERKVLKAMGRAGTCDGLLTLIRRIRRIVPGVALRTTFIVGFPGEGEEEFNGLLSFIERAKFDRMGVFRYSREESTTASALKGQVAQRIKDSRFHRAMTLQAGISLEANRALLGMTLRVLVDEAMGGGAPAIGRIATQAAEIDGMTIIHNPGDIKRGDFVDVRITRALDYDLEAELA